MRLRNGCLFVVLAGLLVALPMVALGGGGGDRERQYDITGTWYGINSYGNYTVYTIVRTGPDQYTADMSFLASPDPVNFGASRMTGFAATIRKVHKNTYEFTTIAYYGDSNYFTPWYFGVAYAAITSGTAEQTGPDTLAWTFYSKVSCNPCWPQAFQFCGTTTACTLPQVWEPWDPFNDPDARCGGPQYNPGFNVCRRVPIDTPCTPN